MNISDIRDEIKSLVNKEIMLKVSGSRAKTTMMKGIVNYNRVNSFFLESGSYLRLKNIVVGYTLPKPLMKNIGLPSSSLRFYVSGENLATITPYKGTDPEVDQSLNGIDASTYPLARIFTFGLNLSF